MTRLAPYGSWASPISLETLVTDAVGLSFPFESGDFVYWLESRPDEGGRSVLVRAPREGNGDAHDVFGPDLSARTTVHEYGGACAAGWGDTVYFANFSDQRLYRTGPGEQPVPITPSPPTPGAWRYAAPLSAGDGTHLIAVRERHADPDLPSAVVNDLVAVRTDGSGISVIAEGHDFYSHPVLSPDGRRLAWTSWDHPNMPWDGTELWEAELDASLVPVRARLVAGGPGESVTQPKYTPDGRLLFVSDRTGWWNLYAADHDGGAPTALAPMQAEFASADWQFGNSNYAVLDDGSIVATWSKDGLGWLGVLRPGASELAPWPTRWTYFSALCASADGRSVLAVAASATEPPSVVRFTPAGSAAPGTAGGDAEVLKPSRHKTVDPAYLSVPEPVTFSTADDKEAHALFYPPTNGDFAAPVDERPPLIVTVHGGPTSEAHPILNYSIQFWTSRGFGVVDVNYGGSTGYGREYRDRLRGQWGVVDVADCVHAAQSLARAGRVDAHRLLIHGGSAGGFTVLCACTWSSVFAAGASYFGVADASALAAETHKFESHYTDGLIGPWPETAKRYRDRSPIAHTDRLRTPLIVFQGLEDKVVPPDQAVKMVAALRDKGVPHAYVAYEGEQHGFRRAENVKRTTEAELYFYAKVLGFEPADHLEPVEIASGDRLRS
ncbi:MAG: prolyl oligopeptidase family serine peptidase [Actinomycetota bacterium]|nr:prolyl oligopeptidase family serine peptidase [Actinomycetota bacterium]